MNIVESTRMVSASWSAPPNPPTIDQQTNTELGAWDVRAQTSMSSAHHVSMVSADGVDLSASVGAGGGAGHSASALCSVRVIFSVDQPMEWTLSYMFDPLPLGYNRHLLRHEGASENLFSVMHWYEGYRTPVTGRGFLDAGRYELWLWTSADQGVGTAEQMRFSVSVPSPGAPAVLAGTACLCMSRRRRR